MATAVIGTMAIKLAAKTEAFNRDLRKAGKSLKSVGAVAKAVTVAAAASFAAIGGAAAFALRAASKQREAELGLAAAIKAANLQIDQGKILQRAKDLQQLTTFSDEVTLTGAAVLASFQLQEQAILDLLPLVQDLAAFNKVDLRSAALGVGKAFATSSGALSRMGVVLDETQKAAFDAATGMERAAILAEVLKQNVGGAAVAMAKTAAGGFAQLKNAAGDVAEEFGFLIERPIAEAMTKISRAASKLGDFMSSLSKESKQNIVRFAALATGLIAVGGAIAALVVLIPLVAGIAVPFIIVAGVIAGLVIGITALRAAWKNDLGGIKTAVTGFVDDVVKAFEKLKTKITSITDGLSETFATFIAFIKGESAEEAFNRVQAVRTALATGKPGGATGAALGGVTGAVGSVASGASNVVSAQLGALKNIFAGIGKQAASDLDAILKALGFDIDKVGKKLKDPLGKGADEAGKSFKKMVPEIKQSVSSFAEFLEQGAAEAIVGFSSALSAGAGSAGADLANALSAAFAVVSPAIQKGGEEMSQAFSGAAKGFEEGGPIGAAVGALAALATSTEAFAEIMEQVNRIFIVIKEVLQRVLKPLVPLVTTIMDIALAFFEFNNTMLGFGTVMEGFGILTKGLTSLIRGVFEVIAGVINGLIGFLIGFAKKVLFGSLERRAVRFLEQGLIQIPNAPGTPLSPATAPELGMASDSATDSINMMGDAAREVSAKLSNVPEGFLIALRRVQSVAGDTSIGGQVKTPEEAVSRSGGGGDTFFVEITDTDEFMDKLEERKATSNAQVFRSSSDKGTFGTARKGS